MRHEDGMTALESLLDQKDAPRAAAIAYVQELGQAASFEEAAEDFAVMISKLLSGDLPVPAEAALQSLREAEDLHFSVPTRLEAILDDIKSRDLGEAGPGDFVVYMREKHEQAYLVEKADDVETPEDAVEIVSGGGGSLIGNSNYVRPLEHEEWEVAKIQEDGTLKEEAARVEP